MLVLPTWVQWDSCAPTDRKILRTNANHKQVRCQAIVFRHLVFQVLKESVHLAGKKRLNERQGVCTLDLQVVQSLHDSSPRAHKSRKSAKARMTGQAAPSAGQYLLHKQSRKRLCIDLDSMGHKQQIHIMRQIR